MDLKEGAEEVAAAQGDHLLRAQGQGWKLGVCGGWGTQYRPNIVIQASWILNSRITQLL